MSDVSESEAESKNCGVESCHTIDEKCGVVDLMFLVEAVEKHPSRNGGSRRTQPDVEKVIGFGIDGGEQSEPLIADPNHSLVECDPIW